MEQKKNGKTNGEGNPGPSVEKPQETDGQARAEPTPEPEVISPELAEQEAQPDALAPFGAVSTIPDMDDRIFKAKVDKVYALNAHIYNNFPRLTTEQDWLRFDDKFYPIAKAVYRGGGNIATIMGFIVSMGEVTTEWHKGTLSGGKTIIELTYFGFATQKWVRSGETEVFGPIIGRAVSTDPFFRKTKGQEILAEDIPKAIMMQKAMTNYKRNLWTQVLGITDFTAEQLAACGLKVDKIRSAGVDRSVSALNPDQVDEVEKFTKRWYAAFNDNRKTAREWLITATEWKKEGVVKQKGFDDPTRLVPGSVKWNIVNERLDRHIQAHEGEAKEEHTAEAEKSFFVMKFKAKLDSCANFDQVTKILDEVKQTKATADEKTAVSQMIAEAQKKYTP